MALRFRPRRSLLLLVAWLWIALLFAACSGWGPDAASAQPAPQAGIHEGQGCTIFYAADDNVALGGNNEDFWNPYTYMWFVPGESGTYGRVYFGYEDGYPQGGVNEAGLFFDGAALAYKPLLDSGGKPTYPGNLTDAVLAESATVPEAVAMMETYSHAGLEMGQLLFGDANGDSVIVEGDKMLPGQESYQVITNFRLSEHPDPPYPCLRYTAADSLLSEADAYSVDLFRDVLEATHQDADARTLYSNIYDLRNGLIYLYYHHDFENPVVIDVAAELAQGFHYTRLATLFPSNAEAEELEAHYERTFTAQFASRVSPIEPDRLLDYAGEYRLVETGEQLNVAVDDGRLYVQPNASLPIELLHESGDDFFRIFGDGSELTFTFQRTEQGMVNGASGAIGDETFTLERTGPVDVTTTTTTSIAPAAAPEPAADGSDADLLWWGVIVVALGAAGLVAFRLVRSR